MLKIRLQRKGKKKQAFFRIVLQEHTEKLQGKYLELLGTYDPHSKELKVNKERAEYWISKGAQPSPTLNNLLVNHKIWDRPKMQSWSPKKKEQTEETTASVPAKAPADKPAAEEKSAESADDKPAEEKKEEKSDETGTDAAPAAA